MTEYKTINAAGTDFIDRLLSGSAWASSTVTFGFTTSTADYSPTYGVGETNSGYQPLTAAQQAGFREAISAWADLINVKFVETTGATADIRAGQSSAPPTAWAYNPGPTAEGGDLWLGTAKGYYTAPKDGNYAYDTLMHELGHTLGLAHPHMQNLGSASGNFTADNGQQLILCPCCMGKVHGMVTEAQAASNMSEADVQHTFGGHASSDAVDAMAYSVMSYSSYANDGRGGYTNGTWDYAQSPMLRDIAAVQYMYGANYSTRAGDTVYSWDPTTGQKFIDGVGQGAPGGNKVFETLWDGGGRDTLDLSAYKSNLSIDLSPGGWSNFGNSQLASLGAGHYAPGNVALAYLYQGDTRSLVENAVGGAGNDTISGNVGNNVLVGGAGDDRLFAVGGNNILAGGSVGNELSFVGLNKADWISANLSAVTGPDGNDSLNGGAGNDIFLPGNGTNDVHGNGGTDTVIINAAYDTLKITKNGADYLISYADGSVKVSDVDYLATSDGIHSLGISDAAENLTLLYQAGLGRAIDASGLNFWMSQMDAGKTLSAMAPDILASAEFTSRFGGSLSDGDYVNVLYKNVLNRVGDAGGVTYWANALAHGESRSDVLLSFAVSNENRDATQHAQTPDATVNLVAVTQQDWMHHVA